VDYRNGGADCAPPTIKKCRPDVTITTPYRYLPQSCKIRLRSGYTTAYEYRLANISDLREKPDLPAGVPEEHRVALTKSPLANVGDESGERLGRVGVVHEQRFRSRCQRLCLV
jgi:hypothetical protein